MPYPVEDISPSLCGDTLVDSQHGKAQVVEVGDAVVWTWPASSTLCAIDCATTSIPCLGTWRWLLILHCSDDV